MALHLSSQDNPFPALQKTGDSDVVEDAAAKLIVV